MDLRDLLQKLNEYDGTQMVNQPDPKPTMSVNMNAQGDSIKELLDILRNFDTDVQGLDRDNDGDHDMTDHEMEAYANEPDEDVKDIDYMVNKLAGGMNKPKDTYDVVSKGDNPMQKPKDEDIVEQFKSRIANDLKEYKGK